jgi:exopolyphosphatase/guanosine-5'-triphosphate,3'-diphosphate pyrophosphatase
MPRYAAIDVGSNAMRLRIVEATSPSDVREVVSERAAVRLGRDVFVTGKLAPAAIADAVDALKLFRESMRAHGVEAYRAVATSAVRDAANGDVLVERAEREAGIHLEVIEGVEEARLARVAVTHAVAIGKRRALLVDIGGGSVELTLLAGDRARESVSLPMGTVRLTEAFLERDAPVTDERRALIEEYIERLLHEAPFLAGLEPDVVIATGGNAEAISALAPARTADGPGIDVAKMHEFNRVLGSLSVRERKERYELRGDRADVIVPAMCVLGAIADHVGARHLIAPGVGLKDGILAELVDRAFRVWDEGGEAAAVEAEAVALGRKYRFDEVHALHVAGLCAALFDQLQELHGLGPEERTWLRLAAILHDIGDFVGYESHHKHTYYLVGNSELMGLTPGAKEVVANVARYHRKAFPDLSHPGFRKLDRRGRTAVRKLAAILRLADAFDREHLTKVHEVQTKLEKGRLTLRAKGNGDLALSRWTASRKADLFEEVFEVEVRVEGAEHVAQFPARPSSPGRVP